MRRISYFGAITLASIAFAGCSKDNSSASENSTDNSITTARTTSLIASRSGSSQTKTITTIDSWEVAWNDGSTVLFDPEESVTGLNPNVDYLIFMKKDAESNWAFLQNADHRQFFKFDSYTDLSSTTGKFKVASKTTEGATAAGLEPDGEYYGYYFLPAIKDNKLPVLDDCPIFDAIWEDETMTDDEKYEAEERYWSVPVSGYELSGQSDEDIQKFLAEYDFLQAYPKANSSLRTIKPSRDGVYDKTSNSYLFNDDSHSIGMRHLLAMVEVDIVFPETAPTKTNLPFTKVQMEAHASNHYEINVFESMAALKADAGWTYVDESEVTGITAPGSRIVCARTDNANLTYAGSSVVYSESKTNVPDCLVGKKCLKFFMLVNQIKDCDHFEFEVFVGSQSNYKALSFNPGKGFRFAPGKYYRLVVEANTADCSSAYDWQHDKGTLTGLYPANTAEKTYWGKANEK